jgi:hypothetical protein
MRNTSLNGMVNEYAVGESERKCHLGHLIQVDFDRAVDEILSDQNLCQTLALERVWESLASSGFSEPLIKLTKRIGLDRHELMGAARKLFRTHYGQPDYFCEELLSPEDAIQVLQELIDIRKDEITARYGDYESYKKSDPIFYRYHMMTVELVGKLKALLQD